MVYATNVSKKYGCFNYANQNVTLNSNDLIQHRNNMIKPTITDETDADQLNPNKASTQKPSIADGAQQNEEEVITGLTPQKSLISGTVKLDANEVSDRKPESSSIADETQQNEIRLNPSLVAQESLIAGEAQQNKEIVPSPNQQKSPNASKNYQMPISTLKKRRETSLGSGSNQSSSAKRRRLHSKTPATCDENSEDMERDSSEGYEVEDQDDSFDGIFDSIVTNAKNIIDAYPKLSKIQDKINEMKDSLKSKDNCIQTKDLELIELRRVITTTKSESSELLKAKDDEIEALNAEFLKMKEENEKLREEEKKKQNVLWMWGHRRREKILQN